MEVWTNVWAEQSREGPAAWERPVVRAVFTEEGVCELTAYLS